MVVKSTGIIDGMIQDPYGGRGEHFNENGIPTYSLPFKIIEALEGARSFALILEDKDSYPVTGGFVWIHWLGANITRFEVKENESQTATDFVQWANSWMSIQGNRQSRALSSYYGGMTPPDQDHIYELHVFMKSRALNEPVAWAGPIVMNTQEEVQQAFTELKSNTFIKEKVEY